MIGYKIRLELNNKQRTLAAKHAGVARYAYNWGIQVCQDAFANKQKMPSAIDLHKKFVAEEKSKHDWLYETSKCSPQQALRNLYEAYRKFHKKQKKSGYKDFKTITVKGEKKIVLKHLPKFKKKGVYDKFYLEANIETHENYIKIPIFGWLKCSEYLPEIKIKNVVISRHSKHWFISFKEDHENISNEKNKIVGVDLGIRNLATLSDGTKFPTLRPYKKHKRKLAILQRKLSKQKKGGENYKRTNNKISDLHYSISCLRKDAIHKVTTYLAKNHSEVVIEDLNVKGMTKNHRLASAILDGGFSEFRRQLTYKCKWNGCLLTVVDRYFPSSKMCSRCKHINHSLKLSDKVFICPHCGLVIDRDENAAKNLENQAVSETVKSCGVANQSTPSGKDATVKHEVNNSSEPQMFRNV